MLKCQTNNQSSTPSIKSKKQRKKTKKTKKKPYIKNYATPDRPPPAAAMLITRNFEVSPRNSMVITKKFQVITTNFVVIKLSETVKPK